MTQFSEIERQEAIRFQRIMSDAPIGAALIEETGKFLSVNQALLDLVGAPSEAAFLGQSVQESGSYQSKAIRMLIAGLHEGSLESNFDVEWTSSWGKQVVARLFVTRLKNAEGAIVYQAFYEDRGTMMDADGSAPYGLASLLDASTNEFHIFDQRTLKYLYVSKRGVEQLGYRLDELMEMTPLEIHPEMTANQADVLLAPLLLGEKKTVGIRLQQQRKDKSIYLVDVRLQCTKFLGQEAFVAVVQDITYNMEMAAALAQARLFLDSAPDPTIVVNSAGQVAFASARAETLLGYSRNELIGMQIETLVPEELRIQHVGLRTNFANDARAHHMGEGRIVKARNKDGQMVPVDVSLSPIPTKDGTLIAASLRDVTKRIEVEAELSAAREEAEKATRAKSRFLASASHDLRQPMQSISQYLWALRQHLTTPEQAAIAKNIEISVDSVTDLLNTLLDISKLDRGIIAPEISNFDISTLCAPILSNFEPAAKEKNLTLRCECGPYIVRSDPKLLLRILENLVSNAIRYTESGTVQVCCTPFDSELEISVSDTGIGIPEDQIEAVFAEYYQVENEARLSSNGLGLGLSIVQQTAHLLGHAVSVESTPAKGSTFKVRVDLVDHAAKTKAPAAPKVDRAQSDPVIEVLIVDDNPGVLDSTKTVLELLDCVVHIATDGDGAIRVLEQGIMPDILITDYRLPGCNGADLVARVRDKVGFELPAILVTGETSIEDFDVDQFPNLSLLHKPTKPRQLIDNIVRLTR